MKHLSAAVLLLVSLSVGSSQPKASIDKSTINLGVIYNGTIEKTRVILKNIGRDTLKILGVHTSCGCTTVKQPKPALRAGESDVMEVEFNSTGYRGKITKHVTIQTNDPASPEVGVTLVGDVVDELQPLNGSSVIWLGAIPLGKEVDQTVSFKNVSGRTIALKGYRSSSPQVVAKLDQMSVLAADTIRVFVKVTPTKTDYSSEQILLETDSKNQSQVPLRVTFIGVKPN
jgi:hypothetical protein